MSDSLASLMSAPVGGNFSLDAPLVKRFYAFAESAAPLAEKAAAIRYLAVAVYGLSGSDAGEEMSDVELVSSFVSGE